jgi:ATP-dependent HslUV protease ATP-binding subunit HslU
VRILSEPQASLIRQYTALLKTESVTLDFTDDGLTEIAKVAVEVNDTVENIGARRLHTVMERLLEEVSYSASDTPSLTVTIDAPFVRKHVGDLAKNVDLSKFIL